MALRASTSRWNKQTWRAISWACAGGGRGAGGGDERRMKNGISIPRPHSSAAALGMALMAAAWRAAQSRVAHGIAGMAWASVNAANISMAKAIPAGGVWHLMATKRREQQALIGRAESSYESKLHQRRNSAPARS